MHGNVGLEKIEECQAARLQAAGIDPSIAKTISRWPSFAAPPMSLFTGDDYPTDAMSNGAEGRVDAKLDVRADGVVSGCSIARSSGNASLDAKTCAILLERARVSPALDKDGKPVAAPVITSVAWRLEQR